MNKTQLALTNAALKLLRPLIKIFLRNGVEFGTFAELLRKVYVEAASDLIEEQGKRPTISSISALTGVNRKEAKRLKELDTPISEETHQKYNRSIRVISGWLNDSRFQDDSGAPASLAIDGEKNSFTELVKGYSGDIPPSAMLKTLELSRCVALKDNVVELIHHAYIPESDPIEKIDILGIDVAELIQTISHNLVVPSDQLLYQRKVSNTRVKPDVVPVFRKMAAEKSQQLLEELDQYLSKNEIESNETSGPENYVALGIYDASAIAISELKENES